VTLNNRGLKQDAITQSYFSKNFNNFGTTYQNDFAARDMPSRDNLILTMKGGSVDMSKELPTGYHHTHSGHESGNNNLQERYFHSNN
jgi:hypothetical protein